MLKQLVTHVPDLVVNRLMDSKMEPPTLEKNYGVLVFADVSGNQLLASYLQCVHIIITGCVHVGARCVCCVCIFMCVCVRCVCCVYVYVCVCLCVHAHVCMK